MKTVKEFYKNYALVPAAIMTMCALCLMVCVSSSTKEPDEALTKKFEKLYAEAAGQ